MLVVFRMIQNGECGLMLVLCLALASCGLLNLLWSCSCLMMLPEEA
jgi:hypothetical protein